MASGGVVSGGACDQSGSGQASLRALGELFRHSLAVWKMIHSGVGPQTFYERRLAFFASQTEGASLVKRKLDEVYQTSLDIPDLLYDSLIAHPLEDIILVHRCLFHGQPSFVGGDLERLCL